MARTAAPSRKPARKAKAPRRVSTPAPVRLNIGAGDTPIEGYTPIDRKLGSEAYPLSVPDGSVDEIRASHVLEHFGHRETLAVLRDWVSKLKPGGKLRVAVPDYDKLVAAHGKHPLNMIEGVLMGGHVDQNDRHGAIFTEQKLRTQMAFLGLEGIGPWTSDAGDCASLAVSLNLEGTKRNWPVLENPRVIAVVSQPRICFTDSMLCLHRALQAIQVRRIIGSRETPVQLRDEAIVDDLVYCGGAFWEKYLTAGIKRAAACGAEVILFADYDSVFTAEDARRVVERVAKNPALGAAFAVQMSRHNDRPLVHMDHINYEGEATPVQLGHFGLAAIRTDVFRSIPKPWFWSMPNPDTGDWDIPGHCDADITFWRVLAEHGIPVEQCNNVVIGHMGLGVKWPAPDGEGVLLQTIENYNKVGRPDKALFKPSVYAGGAT